MFNAALGKVNGSCTILPLHMTSAAQRDRAFAGDDLTPPALNSALVFEIFTPPPDARAGIMATSRADTCDAAGFLVGVPFQHRLRAAGRAFIQLVEDGQLGQIVSVDLRVPWWRDASHSAAPGRSIYARDGGGVLIAQAIHTLELACWLCGPVRAAQALVRTPPMHDLEGEDWAGAPELVL